MLIYEHGLRFFLHIELTTMFLITKFVKRDLKGKVFKDWGVKLRAKSASSRSIIYSQ